MSEEPLWRLETLWGFPRWLKWLGDRPVTEADMVLLYEMVEQGRIYTGGPMSFLNIRGLSESHIDRLVIKGRAHDKKKYGKVW